MSDTQIDENVAGALHHAYTECGDMQESYKAHWEVCYTAGDHFKTRKVSWFGHVVRAMGTMISTFLQGKYHWEGQQDSGLTM